MPLGSNSNKPPSQPRMVYAIPTPKRPDPTPPSVLHSKQPAPPSVPYSKQPAPPLHTNNSFIPNSAAHPNTSFLLTPAAYLQYRHPVPSQLPFSQPLLYPPGFLPYPVNPGLPQLTPQAYNMPYGHSNSYPMPCMVTRPRQMLPHTAAKSPPYRQYQEQPPALFPSPPLLFNSVSTVPHTFMGQQSMQTQYTNPGLPNRQMSAPASYPTETQQPARKRKRNRKKTQQQNT